MDSQELSERVAAPECSQGAPAHVAAPCPALHPREDVESVVFSTMGPSGNLWSRGQHRIGGPRDAVGPPARRIRRRRDLCISSICPEHPINPNGVRSACKEQPVTSSPYCPTSGPPAGLLPRLRALPKLRLLRAADGPGRRGRSCKVPKVRKAPRELEDGGASLRRQGAYSKPSERFEAFSQIF